MTREEMAAIFARGTRLDAGFDPLFHPMAFTLLPRWGGHPSEVMRYVNGVGDAAGEVLFARLIWFVANAERHAFTRTYEFSSPRVQNGFEALLSEHPLAGREWHAYLWLACEYGDARVARSLAAVLDERWSEDAEAVWRERLWMDQCVAWAKAGS